MKIKKAKTLLIFLLALIAVYLAIPKVTVTELVYPIRKDSVFLRNQQVLMEAKQPAGLTVEKKFLYNPGQTGLEYREMSAITADGDSLVWWTINDSVFSTGYHLLVIPDLNESRLDYIEFADEATGRGLTVSVADMRGQGVSGGSKYIPGRLAASDLSLIIDSLQSVFSFHALAVFGSGTGAAIAMQAALKDQRIGTLILENPFISLRAYLNKYVHDKYGLTAPLFEKRLLKNYIKATGLHPDSVNMETMVMEYERPVMFISKISKNFLDYQSVQHLYRVSHSEVKKWMALRTFDEASDRDKALKKYFDRLAIFVNVNLPRPVKTKPRFKFVT